MSAAEDQGAGGRRWRGFPATAVGTRVVVRREVPGGHADVLGTLQRCDDRTLTIRTRRGEVEVALDTVVAARRVPPAQPGRRVPG